jgi:hypothetical protein
MGRSFVLSPELYAQVLDQLSSLYFTDKPGYSTDMNFLRDDLWLCDTVVIEHLQARKGLWEVSLVFAHYQMPLRFLARRITHHTCPRRAEMMAFYMRRLAAKDQRGTLRISSESFHTPLN